MATIIKTTSSNIERNNFDYVRAFAETQTNEPVLVNELVQAYILIAQNLGITPYAFIQTLENRTDNGVYLATQLNSVRVRNSLLGVNLNLNTPYFIAREIGA